MLFDVALAVNRKHQNVSFAGKDWNTRTAAKGIIPFPIVRQLKPLLSSTFRARTFKANARARGTDAENRARTRARARRVVKPQLYVGALIAGLNGRDFCAHCASGERALRYLRLPIYFTISVPLARTCARASASRRRSARVGRSSTSGRAGCRSSRRESGFLSAVFSSRRETCHFIGNDRRSCTRRFQ